MKEERYFIREPEEIITPALVYYKEIIEENIHKMIEIAGDSRRLWPHVKSHKMEALVQLQIEAGITKFKAATIAEAEMAARAGAEDVLVAYPLAGVNIRRFCQLKRVYPSTRFWAVGDDLKEVRKLGQAAGEGSMEVDFLADVNPGMDRTGVSLGGLEKFYKEAAEIPGIKVRGFHCYDGNLGVTDLQEREKRVAGLDRELLSIGERLEQKGYGCSVLVLGGTPSFPCHAKQERGFLSPGTSLLWDVGYQEKYPDEPFVPAGLLLTRVVSRPRRGHFTIDLGYKGIAAEMPQERRGILLGVPHAYPWAQSEEHWVWRMEEGYEDLTPSAGSILKVIPTHICPTTALYPEALVAEKGELIGSWRVSARDRKLAL